MEAPIERGLLQQFLSERDAPCPSCGYNLRGVVGDRCPECAQPLSLSIARPGPAAALTWFLMLAFGWVFTAGVMNSIRNTRSIQSYVDSARNWGFASRVIINSQGQTIAPTYALQTPQPPNGGFWSTAWDVVPLESWIGAAWAYALAAGCGLGLVLIARRRFQPFSAAGDRRMVRFACAMFSVYALWHLTNFVLEFA